MNHASGAVATKDAEVVQVGDAIRQRLRFQALHRFHGLRPDFERLGTPLPAPKDG